MDIIKGRLVYPIIRNGKNEFLHEHDRMFHEGRNYIFIGYVEDLRFMPKINCIYVLGDKVKVQNIPPTVHEPIPQKDLKPTVYSSDKKLNIPINNEDGELMVIAKNLPRLKNISLNEFKSLFGENSTISNNFKYSLENKTDISWKRLIEIMSKLDYDYRLDIIDLRR